VADELVEAGREGWGQIRDDLGCLGETARSAIRALRLDQVWAAASADLDLLQAEAGAAWDEVRADLAVLAAAVRNELDRLPLAPLRQGLRRGWSAALDAWATTLDWASAHSAGLRAFLAEQWARLPLAPIRRAAVRSAARARRRVRVERRRLAARLVPWWRAWLRRPHLLRYLLITDGALAASIVVVVTVGVPALPAAGAPAPIHARAAPARGAGRWQAPVGLPAATPTPRPTLAPTPTPEPVLTATPIPTLFSEWDSWLPTQGGWNGLAECWGGVLAPAGTGRFVWPTDKHYLVGKDYNWRWHPGLDLGGEVGDPIYAADAGVAVYAGWNVYGFGNLVILDHGNNWHSLYAHLSEIHVTCGQGVTQGTLLGLAGSTGRSTGPHLHFEIRSGGVNVNPWEYLPSP
jgi:hypothetical protein